MRSLAVVALVGRLIMFFALLMLVPMGFSWALRDGAADAFVLSAAITSVAGAILSIATRRFRKELQPKDGFLLVGLTWLTLPAFGTLPLLLTMHPISVTDAYFEAMSALTATGATVITGLDELPSSINVWRCFMMWVGGLGVIVLAVAILPLLGVGGSQLFRAEAAGPMKDHKLTPRIADTARVIWVAYLALSVSCCLAYRWAGMTWLDAFIHMCSTVSLGGFSSYDSSFGHWNSSKIEAVAMLFMMLSGINLLLYFVVWRERSLLSLWKNVEVRAFYSAVAVTIMVITAYLTWHAEYPNAWVALRHAAFHVISVATTTGFATQDYAHWPLFAPILMLLLGCFATCAGSTGGGIKMIRLLLLLKQSRREMVRIVHPNVVNPVVLGGQTVSDRVMQSVIAFMMVYGATLVGLTMLMLFTGLDVVTAFTAVIACVNNIGPGLSDVGPSANYSRLTGFQTWICTFAMLLGRLELLSLLVLLTPAFWRK